LNLSLATLCLGQREHGLAIQAEALALRRVYDLRAAIQPAGLRLLMLLVPGDLGANTPLECLLDGLDVDLIFYYLGPDGQWDAPVPSHDVLFVGIGLSDATKGLLRQLEPVLAHWPRPVVNLPLHILDTDRVRASALLQGAPGLVMPLTARCSRAQLQALAAGTCALSILLEDGVYPLIVRPTDSHGGHGLAHIDGPDQLAHYLAGSAESEFFLSRFIDYRSADGYFRKFRIALIDGMPFACHMAVSSKWMIHYVNAGMYEEAWKREEEAAFMADFEGFALHHRAALQAIAERSGLDYFCIDCAQTTDGALLMFEFDHAMVIHAMDLEQQFPFKQVHMRKVKSAMRDYLGARASAKLPPAHAATGEAHL
jgi:hypothetical protein